MRQDAERIALGAGSMALVLVCLLLWAPTPLHAAPKAELWPKWQKHDPASAQMVDHGAWDRFLKSYVVASHPSGIHRMRYGDVAAGDRKQLKAYLQALQAVRISGYKREEQKAYWINLYNAFTVDLITSRFPVASTVSRFVTSVRSSHRSPTR